MIWWLAIVSIVFNIIWFSYTAHVNIKDELLLCCSSLSLTQSFSLSLFHKHIELCVIVGEISLLLVVDNQNINEIWTIRRGTHPLGVPSVANMLHVVSVAWELLTVSGDLLVPPAALAKYINLWTTLVLLLTDLWSLHERRNVSDTKYKLLPRLTKAFLNFFIYNFS